MVLGQGQGLGLGLRGLRVSVLDEGLGLWVSARGQGQCYELGLVFRVRVSVMSQGQVYELILGFIC